MTPSHAFHQFKRQKDIKLQGLPRTTTSVSRCLTVWHFREQQLLKGFTCSIWIQFCRKTNYWFMPLNACVFWKIQVFAAYISCASREMSEIPGPVHMCHSVLRPQPLRCSFQCSKVGQRELSTPAEETKPSDRKLQNLNNHTFRMHLAHSRFYQTSTFWESGQKFSGSRKPSTKFLLSQSFYEASRQTDPQNSNPTTSTKQKKMT